MIPAECSTFRADEVIPLGTTYGMEALRGTPSGRRLEAEHELQRLGVREACTDVENCWQKGLKREKETPGLLPLQHKKREGDVSVLKH